MRLEFREQRRIVGWIDDHADIAPVFRRRSHHGRTADVDVLDRVLERAAGLRHGFAERIEIDHDEIDGRNRMLFQRRAMSAVVTPREDAAVHFRMQRLHPAVEHFREARVVADLDDRQPRLGERLCRAARRQEHDPHPREPAREFGETGLVGDGQQRACDSGGHRRREAQSAGNGVGYARLRVARWTSRTGARTRYRIPYFESFVRSVLRFIPSMSAAWV